MTSNVSAAMAESQDKYRDPDKRVRFEEDQGEEYENNEDTAASTRFGRKYRRQGIINSTNRRRIGNTRNYPSSKYVESEDTMAAGRTEYASHDNTICDREKLRNMSDTGVIYEVLDFGEILGKFQDVEVCITCTV